MNGCYMRPLTLANCCRSSSVSANQQGKANRAREHRNNQIVSPRPSEVRAYARPRRVDEVATKRRGSNRHGRGWQYFSGTVNVHSIIEWMMLAFVIGVAAGLIWLYGSRTLDYALMH